MTVAKANEIFTRYGVYRFLEDCFELFHVEGDQAILEEIGQYLAHKGLAL
ncbi:MAG: DUF3791 domain-containing protein [Deltaproteobacteria bacterium]|nr:DUF3791 domain-containing protein [Deltaproteobacteria bacterium]